MVVLKGLNVHLIIPGLSVVLTGEHPVLCGFPMNIDQEDPPPRDPEAGSRPGSPDLDTSSVRDPSDWVLDPSELYTDPSDRSPGGSIPLTRGDPVDIRDRIMINAMALLMIQ